MAALAVTNAFVAATNIVASQMNANFTDIVTWATGTPTLSTSGSATTVSGTLSVTEVASFGDQIYLHGSSQYIQFEGSSADAHETFIAATNATADRTITFPDATGTVALTTTTMPLTGGTFTGPVTFDGASPIVLEGATGNAFETTIAVTDPTADRIITLPDTTGTVALTSDITSPTWNDQDNILANTIFN